LDVWFIFIVHNIIKKKLEILLHVIHNQLHHYLFHVMIVKPFTGLSYAAMVRQVEKEVISQKRGLRCPR